MAWTAPSTWVAGAVLEAAELNEQVRDNMDVLAPFSAAWASWTPTLTQPGAIAKTVNYAKYMQVGKLVIANFYVSVTGTGTLANAVSLGVPTTAASTLVVVGTCQIFDASASTSYAGNCLALSTTTVAFVGDWAGANVYGTQPSIALGAGDLIKGTLMYEAA